MECRDLDITIVSAEGLKKKKGLFSRKLQAFAVVFVDPSYRRRTSTDTDGGRNPVWNEKISFPVPEFFFHQPQAALTVEIFHHGFFGNSSLGIARIPLHEILQQQSSSSETGPQVSTYQVLQKSGKRKGSIRLSVRVGEKVTVAAPAPPPPPPMGYAQPYYGAPPPGYGGYGYGQQGYAPQAPSRPGMGGMGFGTGLLAGAVGGLLVGEIVDDAFDYGGGGGDFGGGDFGGF